MPDPRAVPVDEVWERLEARGLSPRAVMRVMLTVECRADVLARVGLRWDGTQYLDTEGSQE